MEVNRNSRDTGDLLANQTMLTGASGQGSDEVEVDLGEVFRVILSHLVPIILCTIIGAAAAFIYTKTMIPKKYVSTTKMYVLAKDTSEDEKLTTGDLQVGSLVANDYRAIIQSRQVTEAVIAKLKRMSGTEMMKHESFIKKLSVGIDDGTRVLTIRITDTDPYRACDIADATREIAAERIQSVMDLKAVRLVDQANIPAFASSPSLKRDVLIGALIGFLLATAVVVISFITNDSLKTSEDIERYLGLSMLASIPLASDETKSTRKSRKKVKRESKAPVASAQRKEDIEVENVTLEEPSAPAENEA